MKRTKLKNRQLPNYSRGEEICNMVTHIVGGALAIAALVLCIVKSALKGNAWSVVGSCIYGSTLIVMFTISSIYHGLHINTGKKVMQIIDHCDIYFFIAGTYTPILFTAIRPNHPVIAWVIFGIEWAMAAFAATLNAIDIKKYSKLSMACYIVMGWCIIMALKPTIESIGLTGFIWLLLGGVAYTIGAVLYGVGKRKRYMHCIFHVFVLIAAILQFVCIFWYVI